MFPENSKPKLDPDQVTDLRSHPGWKSRCIPQSWAPQTPFTTDMPGPEHQTWEQKYLCKELLLGSHRKVTERPCRCHRHIFLAHSTGRLFLCEIETGHRLSHCHSHPYCLMLAHCLTLHPFFLEMIWQENTTQ